MLHKEVADIKHLVRRTPGGDVEKPVRAVVRA